jgi:RNA polymerase sigma factor (sigma-70 family)
VTTHTLYSEHQDTIESVLSYVCRVNRLSPDDRDEFTSVARLKLIDDDCAVLRKFGGLSSFKTFIVVVVNRLFLDWRIKEWGKWRPTPLARRLGRVAVELERIVLRDGIDYGQAVQTLISKGVVTSEAECDETWQQLRRRGRRQRIGLDDLHELPAPHPEPLEDEERRALAKRVLQAMRDAMARLPADDQLLFKLRYQDRFTVARIAKVVEGDQKRLYRRFEQLEQQLKASILATGLAEDDIRDLFEGFEVDDEDGVRNGGNGPSTSPNAGGVSL